MNLSFTQRDDHHWDVHQHQLHQGNPRIYTIRGEPGEITVTDMRSPRRIPSMHKPQYFTDARSAMQWIIGEWMNPNDDNFQHCPGCDGHECTDFCAYPNRALS